MNDSFDQLVERYRRELAQYGARAPDAETDAGKAPGGGCPPSAPQPPERNEPTPPEPEERSDPPVPSVGDARILEEETAPPEEEAAPPEEEERPSDACDPRDTDAASLIVRAAAARQAVPVPDADVTIFCREAGKKKLLAFLYTDLSGSAPPVLLPAPDRALSETPGSERPYATYCVRVDHPEYISAQLERVQLFGGVESILPVELTPYPPQDAPKPLFDTELPPHALTAKTEEGTAP